MTAKSAPEPETKTEAVMRIARERGIPIRDVSTWQKPDFKGLQGLPVFCEK